MRRIIQIMHISLDGFVAGTNGELDVFENAGEHLNFLNGLLHSSDCIMLGRLTYEMFNGYWPDVETNEASSDDEKKFSQWYNSVTKIILSKTMSELQEKNTLIVNTDFTSTIENLKINQAKTFFYLAVQKLGKLCYKKTLLMSIGFLLTLLFLGQVFQCLTQVLT